MDHREALAEGAILLLEPRQIEKDGTILESLGESEKIVIRKQIGQGSTSLVYEGRISGGTRDYSPVIVKEFYPCPDENNYYDVDRKDSGELKVSEFAEQNRSYQERKAQFLKCADRQKALSGNENVRELIVRYEGLYQYGDSYYILSHVHSGHVLQLDQFHSLKDKLGVMKDVADVISVLHRNNLLFLDLCPQNLLWVNVSETSHQMKLFDVDSILDLESIQNIRRNDLYLPGRYTAFDAPEMCKLLNESDDEFEMTKRYALTKRMNIYNLGIMFFEILFERLPRQEELIFDNNTEVRLVNELTRKYQRSLCGLRNVCPDVVHLLKTALSKKPGNRKLTAGNLLTAVDHVAEEIGNAPEVARAQREITEASRAQLLETIGTKTRVIAFDESGRFDSTKPEICFIGGFTGDFPDTGVERNAVEELLRGVCERFNRDKLMALPIEVRYPNSLHGSASPFFRKNDTVASSEMSPLVGQERNKYFELERIFKDEYLQKAVMDYLAEKKYRLFVFMNINIPDANTSDASRSNLTDMEKGSNLYERIAILTLYDYVFSMEHDVENYQLELPTRTLNAAGDEDLYNVYTNNKGSVKKSITNTSTYKTALSVMLFEKNKDIHKLDTNYVFNVRPINYLDPQKESTPFLYAADIVCWYIREQIQKIVGKNDAGLETVGDSFLEELQGVTKADIHVYGACEDLYRTMVDKVKRADIGEYYALCYDLEHTDEPYKYFYMEYWIPEVEQFLSACLRTEKFCNQFKDRIPEYFAYMEMFMGKRDLCYEKGLYIAEHMEKHILQLRTQNKNAVLFDLYDIMLRGYNHRGAWDQVKKCITKCEIYKNYVEMPKYIEYIPRVMQVHFNSLNYEAALAIGRKFEEKAEDLKKVYDAFYEVSNQYVAGTIGGEGNVSERLPIVFVGKIYSSIGQAYAFMGEDYYNESKEYFDRALVEFDNRPVDYSITLSYYLHLMISNNRKRDYRQCAVRYFGSDDLYQQMENALTNDYKLFVYVKAFNVFYASDRANWNLFGELLKRIKLIADKEKAQHPWELIYKNLYECILKQSEDRPGRLENRDIWEIRTNALNCVRNAEFTIRIIQIHTKLVFMELEDKKNFDSRELDECLDNDEIDLCEKIIEEVRSLIPAELKEQLDSRMNCYMYS